MYRKQLLKIFDLLLNYFGKQYWWPSHFKGNKEKNRIEIVIGAILTQNTSWKNVEKAIDKLIENNFIDINKLCSVNINKLSSLIKSSGYYRQKSERIKDFFCYIKKKYRSLSKFLSLDINRLRDELLNLKGIGNETADSIILYASNKPIFVVDAYTRRIFSRLGLIREDWDYNQIQEFFHKNLDKDVGLFKEYHALIVELGKNFCKKKPDCGNCPLLSVCKKSMYWKK